MASPNQEQIEALPMNGSNASESRTSDPPLQEFIQESDAFIWRKQLSLSKDYGVIFNQVDAKIQQKNLLNKEIAALSSDALVVAELFQTVRGQYGEFRSWVVQARAAKMAGEEITRPNFMNLINTLENDKNKSIKRIVYSGPLPTLSEMTKSDNALALFTNHSPTNDESPKAPHTAPTAPKKDQSSKAPLNLPRKPPIPPQIPIVHFPAPQIPAPTPPTNKGFTKKAPTQQPSQTAKQNKTPTTHSTLSFQDWDEQSASPALSETASQQEEKQLELASPASTSASRASTFVYRGPTRGGPTRGGPQLGVYQDDDTDNLNTWGQRETKRLLDGCKNGINWLTTRKNSPNHWVNQSRNMSEQRKMQYAAVNPLSYKEFDGIKIRVEILGCIQQMAFVVKIRTVLEKRIGNRKLIGVTLSGCFDDIGQLMKLGNYQGCEKELGHSIGRNEIYCIGLRKNDSLDGMLIWDRSAPSVIDGQNFKGKWKFVNHTKHLSVRRRKNKQIRNIGYLMNCQRCDAKRASKKGKKGKKNRGRQ